jgi:hypothetical protein
VVIPVPRGRRELAELRELLETHLCAMQALMDEHRRTLDASLRAVEERRVDLRPELRALADARAPWVRAMAETRALLYVALHELVASDEDAGATMQFAAPRRGAL